MTTAKSTQPTVVERAEQPYVAVRRRVTIDTIPEIADRIPEVFGWLAERGIAPAGSPFFRYNVIDMDRELEMEAGVPVAAALDGDGEVFAAVLPAGRYAAVSHVGHPEELEQVTADLLDWAREQGLAWDMSHTAGGERWGCRLEVYHTDPAEQPDLYKWTEELLFRLAD
jgi:effector-binding domain-containing protein